MKRLIITCLIFLFSGGYIFAQEIGKSDTLAGAFFHLKELTNWKKSGWDSCYLRKDLLWCYSLRNYIQTRNEINEKISHSLNSFNFRDSLPLSVNLKYSPWVEFKGGRYFYKPLDVQEWCHRRFISEPENLITPQEEFYIYRVIAEEKLLRYNANQ